METAARFKSAALGLTGITKRTPFADIITRLETAGTLTQQEATMWHSFKESRNLTSHPDDQTIIMPGQALFTLSQVADYVNRLFANP